MKVKFNGNFKRLCEDVLTRYQQGGLLQGDIVQFAKDALKNDKIRSTTPQMQEIIKDAINSGLNLRVSCIKTERANTATGIVGGADAPTGFFVDLVVEYAPGLWRDPITVPIEVLERIETGINLAPVPDSLKRPDDTQVNPSEAKPSDIKREDGEDATKSEDENRNLKQKNVTLPASNKWDDKKPGGGNTPKKK